MSPLITPFIWDDTSEGNIARPLADVEVILHTADPFEEIARTKTDSQGKYSFADVKPGEYVFSAFIPGQCGIVGLGTEPVTVEAGNVVIKDIRLPC